MEQKRFLTADEVFQRFHIDADALASLVESGAVKALADLGSFKYRTEDFVSLVNSGTISIRNPEQGLFDSDSDVRIVGLDVDGQSTEIPVKSDDGSQWEGLTETLETSLGGQGSSDSDSDVRLAPLDPDLSAEVKIKSETDHERNLVGSSDESSLLMIASPSDSDVSLVTSDVKPGVEEPSRELGGPNSTSEFTISPPGSSSEVSLVDADSGIRLSDEESGIRLANDDSGISLANEDSGISLVSDGGSSDDSGISLVGVDSGITLVSDDLGDEESGIRLATGLSSGDDSGISLVDADSGISLLGDADSGISLMDGDSGITAEGDVFDPKPTKGKRTSGEIVVGSDATQTLDVSDELFDDSGFDVNLAEEEKTSELKTSKGTTPGYPKTVVDKQTKSPFPPPVLSLSETFKLDEPPEVEDLEISDDLEDAEASDFSDEFAAVEEDEVFEASDDDFSAAEMAVPNDEDLSDGEIEVPAAKVKKGPKEPQWGPVAVAPIAISALTMLAAVTVLGGGLATMWTGGEAPGPVGTLISTLAGLSPF